MPELNENHDYDIERIDDTLEIIFRKLDEILEEIKKICIAQARTDSAIEEMRIQGEALSDRLTKIEQDKANTPNEKRETMRLIVQFVTTIVGSGGVIMALKLMGWLK
jgi:septal ring factor EnvC (AmiA/AmiB activator)